MSRIYKALRKAQEEKDQEIRSDSFTEAQTQRLPNQEEGLTPSVEYSPKIPKGEEAMESAEPILPEEIGLGAVDEKLVALTDRQSVTAEQFRKIRAVLSQLRMAGGCNTIMVTSALPQEGKSLIACNLGATIAQGFDDEALLIDCDLRKPKVHALFGLNQRPGLREFLTGHETFSQIIQEVQSLRLKVIAAGRRAENPGELLSSDRMVEFLQELKAKYRNHYIILDTTPVFSTAEAGILAQVVDGIIVVIMAGKTPRYSVKRALEEITHDKVIGVVLNTFRSKEETYSKHHYGYYQYSSRNSHKRNKSN